MDIAEPRKFFSQNFLLHDEMKVFALHEDK